MQLTLGLALLIAAILLIQYIESTGERQAYVFCFLAALIGYGFRLIINDTSLITKLPALTIYGLDVASAAGLGSGLALVLNRMRPPRI